MIQKVRTLLTKIIHSPLFWILLICACWQFFLYSTYEKPLYTPDTWSYVDQKNFLPEYRTPVYPTIVKAIFDIGGLENCFKNIVRFQKVVFFLSIIFFYLALKKITKKKVIIVIASLLYGCLPSIIVWNVFLLTESLTISLTTFIIYLTISYLTKPTKLKAGMIALTILVLIFTRPAMLFLLPIYILYWLIRLFTLNKKQKAEKTSAKVGLISCAIVASLVLGYCCMMKAQYNYFGLSIVSDINKTWMLIDSDVYKKSQDSEKIEIIDMQKWSASTRLMSIYGYDGTAKYVKETISQNRLDYIKYLVKKVVRYGSRSIHAVYSENTLDIDNRTDGKSAYLVALSTIMFPMNFGLIYIILAIGIAYLVYNLIKNRSVDWLFAFLIAVISSNFILSMFMAPFELQRLFTISVPALIILTAYCFSKFVFRKKKEIDFNETIIPKKKSPR